MSSQAGNSGPRISNNFLSELSRYSPTKMGKLVGAVPSLVRAGHHGTPGQGTKERTLRRGIRRTREALLLARKGVRVPQGLIRNIVKILGPPHHSLVFNRQWSLAETVLLRQLDDLPKAQTQAKRAAWAADMVDPSKACKWIKQTSPLLENGAVGRVVACLREVMVFGFTFSAVTIFLSLTPTNFAGCIKRPS